jgi:Predicted hydrolases or acyltransferases (alpha/beta hydrolase superfamily)
MKKRDIALAVGGGVAAAVAVKMLTRAKRVDWESVRSRVPHSDKSRFVNVDGARVHFQEFGDESDPPIILIHGYTASVYVWHTVAPLIADAGFRVVAIDLIGFGYSEKPSWFEYTINAQARMITRFMDRLGIGKATIVGSSYGGAVAATVALDYAARVEKLVLVDAVINDDVKNHPVLKLGAYRGLGEVITPFLIDSRRFMRRRMHHTLAAANHHMITDERVENILRPLSNAEGHRSALATSRNWDANRIEQDAHLINHPTLLIWGEDDTVIPVKNGHKLYDSMLHSRLVVLKDCGHVPQEEKSEAFVGLVTDFCRQTKSPVSA